MKPIRRLFPVILALALLSCSPSRSMMVPTQTEAQPPSPTIVPPTSAPTLTRTDTATLTAPATLEPEQAMETIRTLLQQAADCDAPCFWGIVPGQTTLGEARNIFTRLGLQIASTTHESKDFYGIEYDFDSGLSVTATLTVQDEIVRNLRVDILPELQKVGVQREWLAYSPETLINRYGSPSSVAFAMDWGPRSFFEMDMYFDAVDLIVAYAGHDIIPRQKGSPQVCPLTDQFEIIRIWMGKDPVYPPADAVSLPDATDMTMNEFSQLMIGNPHEACFTVKGDVFP